MAKRSKTPKEPFVCYCNGIPKSVVEAAIARGCHSLDKVADATTAGIGPCGGSCRPLISEMISQFIRTGNFPKKLPRRR